MERNFDFLGPEVSSKGRDRAYVIPVPIEWSATYGKGTARAPRAILTASLQVEVYNSALNVDLEGAGIVTLHERLEKKQDVVTFVREHRDMFRDALPCFVGGEHSITPWILEGLGLSAPGIVWLDAHADMRESYLGEKESHACAARNALPYGELVQIGVRSFSREERDFLRGRAGTQRYSVWCDDARRAIRRLPESIYLSIDFDSVDPSILRAVGTPEPDGLLWDELMDVLSFVFERKSVVAMDAVELCPMEHDETSNFIAAKIIYEALSRFLAKGDSL
jgi:agmatinase